MLILLSPAKSLDMQRQLATPVHSMPAFTKDIATLVALLRRLPASGLQQLMGISAALATLNHARFQAFSATFTPDNAAPALAAFDGDVYAGLNAQTLSAADLEYAQAHLRILSGLYGLLRPLDLMQPYRLEMGTRLANDRGEDLYDFWGESLAQAINAAAEAAQASHIINLASQEYFKAAREKALQKPVLTPHFKEDKGGGKLQMISFFAKKARGAMARWILINRIERAKELRDFAEDGYHFHSINERKGELLFVRKSA